MSRYAYSTQGALALAERVLAEPPRKPHIVRPVPRGELVFRFALPLTLCKTTNLTRESHVWEAAKRKRAAWERIRTQWFRAGCPKGPLPGRPQVICLRLSSREPDTYSDFGKVAVDMLGPPKGKSAHGLGLLVDDRPALAEVVQYWEPASPSEGCCVFWVRAEKPL